MAFIAGKLGNTEDGENFKKRAAALAQAVNTILWDEKDGFYYDRNEKTGESIRIKSIAGFLPLWAGIATPERAKRLVQEHLTNEKEILDAISGGDLCGHRAGFLCRQQTWRV